MRYYRRYLLLQTLFLSATIGMAQTSFYKSKLVHGLGINVGLCFQIKGW